MNHFKNINILRWPSLATVIALLALACTEPDPVTYDLNNAVVPTQSDAYVQVNTPVIGFQAGTEKYGLAVNVINGVNSISKLNVYSTFTGTSGVSSNEVLLTSYPVSAKTREVIIDSLTYADLKAGLTLDGDPLPEDELELAVGASWALRLEGVNAAGEVVPINGGGISVAVLSPYAGIYEYSDLEYWRINVLRDDVTGPSLGGEVYIGSVDENTFSHNDWWGPFSDWTGSHFEFDVDFENPIAENVYPVVNFQFPDGLYSGTSALTCASTPGGLPNVNCGGSNRLIVDPVENKHRFILSYGYVGAGGNREFYNVLDKK
jgi:hypothetical protein